MISRGLLVACLLASLSACTSSIKPDETGARYRHDGQTFSVVDIVVTPQLEEKFAGNGIFNALSLRDAVRRQLRVKQLYAEDGPNKLEVTLTEGRLRSNFNAIVWGVWAGSDYLSGDVVVKDASNQVIGRYHVSASYALGGGGGGRREVRTGWLYDAFAKEAVKGIVGDKE